MYDGDGAYKDEVYRVVYTPKNATVGAALVSKTFLLSLNKKCKI